VPRLTRCCLALACCLVLLQGADLSLTYLLLARPQPDVYEANPLAAAVLARHGWAGVGTFKVLCCLAAVAAALPVCRRRAAAGAALLAGLCLLMAGVVGYSGALLARPPGPPPEVSRITEEGARLEGRIAQVKRLHDGRAAICLDVLSLGQGGPAGVRASPIGGLAPDPVDARDATPPGNCRAARAWLVGGPSVTPFAQSHRQSWAGARHIVGLSLGQGGPAGVRAATTRACARRTGPRAPRPGLLPRDGRDLRLCSAGRPPAPPFRLGTRISPAHAAGYDAFPVLHGPPADAALTVPGPNLPQGRRHPRRAPIATGGPRSRAADRMEANRRKRGRRGADGGPLTSRNPPSRAARHARATMAPASPGRPWFGAAAPVRFRRRLCGPDPATATVPGGAGPGIKT
jgi:hypothetical protein